VTASLRWSGAFLTDWRRWNFADGPKLVNFANELDQEVEAAGFGNERVGALLINMEDIGG